MPSAAVAESWSAVPSTRYTWPSASDQHFNKACAWMFEKSHSWELWGTVPNKNYYFLKHFWSNNKNRWTPAKYNTTSVVPKNKATFYPNNICSKGTALTLRLQKRWWGIWIPCLRLHEKGNTELQLAPCPSLFLPWISLCPEFQQIPIAKYVHHRRRDTVKRHFIHRYQESYPMETEPLEREWNVPILEVILLYPWLALEVLD